MANRSRFQYSLLTLLGVMFAAAFFFAWLRVGTEFKFILFGLVIMPAIAIGFAILMGLMPQPSVSLSELKSLDVAPIYATLPRGLMRRTRLRQARSWVPAAVIIAAISGCAVMSRVNFQSATWYYAHISAALVGCLMVVYAFASRAIKVAKMDDELVFWASSYHKQERRSRAGLFGLVPMILMQLGQFLSHRDPISETAALVMATIFLMGWLANGHTGLFERGIVIRGQAIPWAALCSRYWVADTDFVVFATSFRAPVTQPLFFHVPTESRVAVEQVLAERLPLANSPNEAWGDRAS